MADAKRRRAGQMLKLLGGAVGLLLVLALGAYALACHTAFGRERVRRLALARVEPLLRGSLEVSELARLGVTGVELRGVRVRDPAGDSALELDRLTLQLSPLSLLEGEVRIDEVRLAGARVELADLGDRRGLLAAVALREPGPPAPPAAGGEASALGVHVERIAVEDAAVGLDVEGFGRLDVDDLSATGSFAMDPDASAKLTSLSCTISRDGAPLATLQRTRAVYVAGGGPSTLQLEGRLGDAALSLEARARLPGDPAFERAPLSLSLRLDALDGSVLRAIGQDALADRLLQPVDVQLEVVGTAREPRATLTLRGGGGTVVGRARLSAERRATLELEVTELAAAELVAGAPAGRLSTSLEATAELGQAPETIPLTLELRGGSFDGWPLPRTSARGRLAGERIEGLVVEAEGYGGELSLEADAELTGRARGTLKVSLPRLAELPPRLRREARLRGQGSLSLSSRFSLDGERLDASATLQARALALPGLGVGRVDARLEAHGDPKAPRVEAEVRATELALGGLSLRRARATLEGGPDRYAATLSTTLPDGNLDAELDLSREARAVVLALSAKGRVRGRPFSLSLERARIGHDGSLGVVGLRAAALGQAVEVEGAYADARGEGVTLIARDIDLATLGRALELELPLKGRASVRARARGRAEAPEVELTLKGVGVGLAGRPGIDLTLDASLDTPEGRAALSASANAGEQLVVKLRGDAELPRGRRVGWPERARAARLDASLELSRLASAFVDAWLPGPLPLGAELTGRVQLTGTGAEPQLQGELHARGQAVGDPRTLELTLVSRYAAGELSAELSARDPDGPWIDARAHLAHPGQSTAALLRDAPRLLHESAFDASLQVAARPLGVLPLMLPLPPPAARLEVGASLSASHAPRTEPEAELTLSVLHPRSPRAREACLGAHGDAALSARLAAGQLDASLTLRREGATLVELFAGARVALSEALAARGSPAVDGVGVRGGLTAVEIGELPVVCRRARGALSGTLEGTDLESSRPRLSLSLEARGLGLGNQETVDASVNAELAVPESVIDVKLRHGETRSSLTARVPVSLEAGAIEVPDDAPLSARLSLDRLPVGALVPAEGPISRVAGTLSARVDVEGTLAAPRARGELSPHGVAFTATALAQPLSDIHGRVVFDTQRVRIERLSARDGSGTLSLRGTGELGDQGRMSAKLSLEAEEFPLRQQGRIAGELDARAGIGIEVEPESVQVAITLQDVSAWLLGGEARKGIDLDPHPDIIDPRAPRLPEPEPGDATARRLRLTLDASESFWVRRDDFAVKLSTELVVEVVEGQVRVEGPVLLRRGYLQLLGSTFELDAQSRLDFIGSTPPDPALAIKASTDNRRSGERIEVRIGGRASAPELEFLVDDVPTTAGRAAQALFGGGEGADDDASGQAKSFVAGVMAGVMAMSARRELGDAMPILLVEPASGEQSTRLRAGFELDALVPGFLEGLIRGVYLEGIGATGSEQQQTGVQGGVLLELYLPHDLVTSGQYGPGETWSLDLGWEP